MVQHNTGPVTTDGADERPSAVIEATTCVIIPSFLVGGAWPVLEFGARPGGVCVELKIPNHIW